MSYQPEIRHFDEAQLSHTSLVLKGFSRQKGTVFVKKKTVMIITFLIYKTHFPVPPPHVVLTNHSVDYPGVSFTQHLC